MLGVNQCWALLESFGYSAAVSREDAAKQFACQTMPGQTTQSGAPSKNKSVGIRFTFRVSLRKGQSPSGQRRMQRMQSRIPGCSQGGSNCDLPIPKKELILSQARPLQSQSKQSPKTQRLSHEKSVSTLTLRDATAEFLSRACFCTDDFIYQLDIGQSTSNLDFPSLNGANAGFEVVGAEWVCEAGWGAVWAREGGGRGLAVWRR